MTRRRWLAGLHPGWLIAAAAVALLLVALLAAVRLYRDAGQPVLPTPATATTPPTLRPPLTIVVEDFGDEKWNRAARACEPARRTDDLEDDGVSAAWKQCMREHGIEGG